MSDESDAEGIRPRPSDLAPPTRDRTGEGSKELPCLSQPSLNRRSMGEVLRTGAIIGAILGTLCSIPLTYVTPENSGKSTIRLLPMLVLGGLLCAGVGAAIVAMLLAFCWIVLAPLLDLGDGIGQLVILGFRRSRAGNANQSATETAQGQ